MTITELNEKYGKMIDSIEDFRKEIEIHTKDYEFTDKITGKGLRILREMVSALNKSQDILEEVDELEEYVLWMGGNGKTEKG